MQVGQRRGHAGASAYDAVGIELARLHGETKCDRWSKGNRSTGSSNAMILNNIRLLQALSDYVRRFVNEHALDKGSPPTVATVAKLFRTLAYENKDRLMAGLIIAGWDPVDGGAVWEIPLGGACIKQAFSIGGSGSSYIYGFVDNNFRPGMSREECLAFVRQALSHAMARDGSSGELQFVDKAEGIEINCNSSMQRQSDITYFVLIAGVIYSYVLQAE